MALATSSPSSQTFDSPPVKKYRSMEDIMARAKYAVVEKEDYGSLMNLPNSLNKERPFSRQNSLKVNEESNKINKNAPLPQRVIRVSTQNFKDVIQSLTGYRQPTAPSEVSPPARLASTEITTSKKKEKSSWSNVDTEMKRMLDNGVQMSQFLETILPEPAILPPFTSENFLPGTLPPITSETWAPIPSDFFSWSPITWPVTPTDTFLEVTFPMIPSGTPGTRSDAISDYSVGTPGTQSVAISDDSVGYFLTGNSDDEYITTKMDSTGFRPAVADGVIL